MFIILDDSIAEIVNGISKNDFENYAFNDFFRHFITAYKQGKHFLWASRKAINMLKINTLLEEDARRCFIDMDNSYTQYKSIVLKSKFEVRIKFYNNDITENEINKCTTEKVVNKEKDCINISYKYFIEDTLWAPTKFLLENQNEYDVYKVIVKNFINEITSTNTSLINADVVHGGGSTIGKCYSRYQYNSFLFSIVDSDKKAPKSSNGQTAKQLISNNKKNCNFTDFYILKCHECENLIPVNLFIEQCTNTNTKSFLEELQQNSSGHLLYFDFKNGLIPNAIFVEDKDQQEIILEYWGKVISDIRAGACRKCSPCLKKGCDSIIIKGLGEKVTSKLLRNIETKKYTLPPYLNELWNHIGKTMFSCFASGGEKKLSHINF